MLHKRSHVPRKISKIYYLAFEGKRTEQRYFAVLENEKVFSRNVCTVRLHRGITEDSMSNPKSIIKLVIDYRNLQKTGIYSTDLFVSHVFDCLDRSNQVVFDQASLVREYAKELKRTLMSQKAANDKQILNLSEAESIAAGFFQTKLNRMVIVDLSDLKRPFCDDSIEDEFCIIVDRDEKSFTETQVEEAINTCEEQRMRLIISNPCFELWLLLHFDVSKQRILECVKNNSLKKEVSYHSRIYEGLIDGVNSALRATIIFER